MKRICQYKYCDKDITDSLQQVRYCSKRCIKRQAALNWQQLNKIQYKITKHFEKDKIPTIITPQASRYQDLLRYSTTVMSNFE